MTDAALARQCLRRLHAAVNAHDAAAVAALCAEHVVWEDPAARDGSTDLAPFSEVAFELGTHPLETRSD